MSSLWFKEANIKKYDELSRNEKCEVCIIGAGIFGLTCAYYLSKMGLKVIVLEKDSIGEKVSGHTTGKITSQHGLFYHYLQKEYGNRFAKEYLEANEKAIKNIKEIIELENIKCDFEYQNNYVYTTNMEKVIDIKKEIQVLEELNFNNNYEFVNKVELPFEIKGAICFKNQAQFHPIKYLQGLCESITKTNGKIYANSLVTNIEKRDEGTYNVITSKYNVNSKYVIIASHFPFLNIPGFYFAKMYQSTSYVISFKTKREIPNGMYISNSNPIYSFRRAKYQGEDVLLIGGSDHKTGQEILYKDTYGKLEKEAKEYYPDCEIICKWNTRDCISLDKLPYIGEYSDFLPNVFVGTGFKKWGMTLSNVAANIITDKIIKKHNKYEYLFKSSRLKPIKNIDEMKNMIVQTTKSLVIDKIITHNEKVNQVKNNSGGIVEIENEKIGVYKDRDGKIYAVKPICTHLGCLLSWNDVDKTWDCPCHGSRFDFEGKNIYDPAYKNLEIYDL